MKITKDEFKELVELYEECYPLFEQIHIYKTLNKDIYVNDRFKDLDLMYKVYIPLKYKEQVK